MGPKPSPVVVSDKSGIEWTLEEKHVFEKGLEDHGMEPSLLCTYIKIAQNLPRKEVRDIAKFHKWLNTRPHHKPRPRSLVDPHDSMLTLLEKTKQDLRQMSANVRARRLRENIGLFHRIRLNIETMLSFARFLPAFENAMDYFPKVNHMMVDSIQHYPTDM